MTMKAARTDAAKLKKLDETGLDVASCRHFKIQGAVNMTKGETFKHTNFLHCRVSEKNFKFICLDVMCRYWQYAERVIDTFGMEFPNLKETKPFLSRMHAYLHSWYCRVIFVVIIFT